MRSEYKTLINDAQLFTSKHMAKGRPIRKCSLFIVKFVFYLQKWNMSIDDFYYISFITFQKHDKLLYHHH